MNTAIISRRPLFWIFLTAIFFGGTFFSYHYFAKVFPIINLDISMNRTEALKAGKELAEKNNWGPQDYSEAVLFDDDNETQNFIELEGGGKKVFAAVLQEKYFSPYTWQVRHFKENDPNETLIEFTPEGKPYGFEEKLSEDTPGAALTSDQAREIAVKHAQEQWHTDFSNFSLVESSQETKRGGRIDHTFVYERTDKKVADAPYRLKLVVSGDKLTHYELSVKVPEAFRRRYEEMRSANNTIAQAASIALIILYIFGGCVLGLFFLLRRRWLIWHTPMLWAAFIALLQFLNGINSLPMYWMRYDTQLTQITFLANFLISLTLQFFAFTGIFTLIFVAAESLGRKALPDHIQFWHLWSRQGAATIQTLGRTVGGYLIMGFDFAFIIAFYALAFRYFNWWTPSESLINPNIMSYYAPWLASISQALQAGFMEECLFRAIPLSCALLIGKKRGNKNFWLILGMILQAIIFSAAHANYPAQPAYARLVELIIPSFVFGFIYLFYGLLPSIISHFVYDVIWMALPLFVATAPGIWLDKLIVIICSLVPLFVVFGARLLTGKWSEMPQRLYNYAWQPKEKEIMSKPPEKQHLIEPQKQLIKIVIGAGILGFGLWYFCTSFVQDGLPIRITQKSVLAIAKQELQKRESQITDAWTAIPYPNRSVVQDIDRFVWQTGGKELYNQLLGTYITPAQWNIRFAQFGNENIVERAEEYTLSLDNDGKVVRFFHQLPESRPGKALQESEARTIAHQVLKNTYHLEPEKLEEISAVSTKHPNRLDWVFTFKDPAAYPQQQEASKSGEARIAIKIAGDKVVDDARTVFIPEQWSRADKQKQAIIKILSLLCTLFLGLFLIIGGMLGLLSWSQHTFATKIFALFFVVLTTKSIIQLFNVWHTYTATFKTSEPYWHQLTTLFSSFAMQILFKASAYGLLAGFMARAQFRTFTKITRQNRILMGISFGALLSGIEALCTKLSLSSKPFFAEYMHASALFPSISYALTLFTTFIYSTLLLYMIFWAIDYITNGWHKNKILGILLFMLVGIAMYAATESEFLPAWIFCGLIIGTVLALLYLFGIRFDRSVIPLLVGTTTILDAVQQAAFMAYPGAFAGALLAFLIISLFSYWWSTLLEQENKELP